MKKLFLLLVLLITTLGVAQEYTWAARGGGDVNFGNNPNSINEYEHVRDIVVDSQNNYYFLATVSSNNTNLNGTAFTNYNRPNFGNDTFLFSTDCNGNVRWQKTIGGEQDELTQHLSIDSNDNIYVSGFVVPRFGTSQGFVHFDTDVIINSNLDINTSGPHNKSLYLIKYDNLGNFQWLQRPQRDNADVTDIQKSYTFGHYSDSNNVTHWLMTMGAGTHINGAYTTATDDYAIFRFDDQGTYLGQTPVDMVFINGRPTYSAILTMDETLNRYYVSAYRRLGTGNSLDFLGSPISNNVALGAIDANNGNILWRMENTGGNNFTGIYDLKVDSQSNVYLSGRSFSGNGAVPDTFAGYTMDQTSLSGGVTSGPFIIKLNSQGNLLWGSNPDFGAQSGGYKIALNGNEVALATALRISGNWGSQTYTRSSSWVDDPVVARFDATTGNVLGLEDVLAPGGSQEMATAIATDNFGNYVVGGYFRSTLFQNNTAITPLQINGNGATDFWYARLATTDCNGVPLSIDEENISKVSIFPNPVTDVIQVTGNLSFTSYSIYNISGQQVLSGAIDDNKIEVLSLTSGVYFLNLKSDVASQTLKLVKE